MNLDQASFLVKERRFVISDKQKTSSSQENNSRVYVVIPVFNRWKFTKKCIQQLLDQTYSQISIIVSDGGSSDETLDETRRLFPDVVVLQSKLNSGGRGQWKKASDIFCKKLIKMTSC